MIALGVALVAAWVEAVSLRGMDNLWIPLVTFGLVETMTPRPATATTLLTVGVLALGRRIRPAWSVPGALGIVAALQWAGGTHWLAMELGLIALFAVASSVGMARRGAVSR